MYEANRQKCLSYKEGKKTSRANYLVYKKQKEKTYDFCQVKRYTKTVFAGTE